MTHEVTEAEVRHSLATDPHYPLGEPDAMKWAIAFCQTATMANPLGRALRKVPDGDAQDELVGIMVGWFANCMATQEMIDSGGSLLNADGMQSILDGEMVAHPELHR